MRISESALAYLRNEASFCSNRGDVMKKGLGLEANLFWFDEGICPELGLG